MTPDSPLQPFQLTFLEMCCLSFVLLFLAMCLIADCYVKVCVAHHHLDCVYAAEPYVVVDPDWAQPQAAPDVDVNSNAVV